MASDSVIDREAAWAAYKKIEPRVLTWLASLPDSRPVHRIDFLPHMQDLEVYVFFETNADLAHQNVAGVSDQIRRRFEEEFDAFKLGPEAGIPIRFEFDSHENVLKNYQGSYFFRLR